MIGSTEARVKSGGAVQQADGARMRSFAARLALVMVSIVFSLVVFEAGFRVVRWGPAGLTHWPNLAGQRMSYAEHTAPCSYAYDATLGWTSPHDCSVGPNTISTPMASAACPRTSPLAEPPVLATGSSFALGQEVDDDGKLAGLSSGADRAKGRQCRRQRLRPRPDGAAHRTARSPCQAARSSLRASRPATSGTRS